MKKLFSWILTRWAVLTNIAFFTAFAIASVVCLVVPLVFVFTSLGFRAFLLWLALPLCLLGAKLNAKAIGCVVCSRYW